ncbi:FAD/NAD(P)-binding protein [Streptomyces sp. NPDC057638]|uniref:FAD/NAD(P)-binding protein n=1 Tax=Streptomyces sp. NPDC057638 TaxID=3346190 RepID=UPI00369F03EC
MSEISIGVVGGGASAVCLIDALAQAQGPAGKLTVFEPSPHLWRGRAYQVDACCVKVNAAPDDMSVRVGDPKHFERWLLTHERIAEDFNTADLYSGSRFAPRRVYGDYLEASAGAALAELRRQGWRIDLVGDSVSAAQRTSDGVRLTTGGGGTSAFDYVVLCIGSDSPKDIYGLEGAPGFITDPYPVSDSFGEIGTNEDVAIIGSGLTAVDIILALTAQGHRGHISLVSRRGVLPGVRQRPLEFEPRYLTKERMRSLARDQGMITLDQFAGLVTDELKDAGAYLEAVHCEVTSLGKETPEDRLRRQFAAVRSSDPGLRILQRAVPDIGPDVWPLLREEDRVRLLRHHYRTIMSLCCPMPPGSACVLLDLVDGDQLTIRHGLQKVRVRSGGDFEVSMADGTAFTADRVINSVNSSSGNLPTSAMPLLNSLLRGGVASRHPHGGLHLERATSRLIAGGTPDPRLYGLGLIGAGSLFFAFGIPSLVDRSEDIVASILQSAGATHAPRSENVLLPA